MNKLNQYKDSLVGLTAEKVNELVTYKAVQLILAEPNGVLLGGRNNAHVTEFYESHVDYSVYK